MRCPELSVVMSVYNGQEYLEESIQSILNQTYPDFEFIVLNDGSTDGTLEIIRQVAQRDKRVVPVNQNNMGLVCSLNRGITFARGKYIARQDADDVSLPQRLEKQMDFMKSHPQIVLCGTWFREENEGGGVRVRRYPAGDAELRKYIMYANYFCHPSVIFSKTAFEKAGRYDESLSTGQDFECWMRMKNFGKVANIPEVLVNRRIGTGRTISWQQRKKKIELWEIIFKKHFKSWHRVNKVMFIRFYLPLLIYGYIPVPVIKLARAIRYR